MNPLFLVFFDHMSESNYLILLRMRFHDDFNFWWFSLMVCYWKYFFDFFFWERMTMARIIIRDIAIYRLKMILDDDHRVDLYLQPLSWSHVIFYGDKVEKKY